jgi:PAS domain S-box-containing protein
MLDALEKASLQRMAAAPAGTAVEDRLRLALSAGRFGNWQLELGSCSFHCSQQCKVDFGFATDTVVDYAAFRAAIHPEDLPHMEAAISAAVTDGSDYEADVRCVWPDGSTHWINTRGRPVFENGRLVRLLGVTLDITERKQAEHDLRISESRLSGQKAALELVVSGAPIEVVLERLVLAVQQQVGAESRVALFVVDRDGQCLRFGASVGLPETYARALDGLEISASNPSCAAVALTGRRVIVPDVTADPLWQPYLGIAHEYDIRSVWSFPIRTRGGEVLGTLAVCRSEPGKPGEPLADDIESLELLASTAAIILEQHKSAQEHRAARDELERSRSQLQAELADSKLLQRVSAALIREDDESALYDTIVGAAAAIAKSDFSTLQMFCPDRGEAGEFRLMAWRGLGEAGAQYWHWAQPAKYNVCGQALRRRERVIVPDVENCEFLVGTDNLAMLRGIGVRSVQTTPLWSRAGQVIGMLSTHWREPHWPSERDLRLLDILARQAADLIERHTAADTLRASEERYRSLVNVTADVLWTMDRNGEFVAPQVAWADYTGQGWDEYRGSGWLEAVHPDDRERVRGEWADSVACATLHYSAARLWNARAGAYRHTVSRATPVFNADGTVREWVGSDTDVHEQIQLAESLQESARRKDEFLATLAHELRNPLAPLRNGLQVIKLVPHDTPKIERAAAMMDRQLVQMVRLIDDLLDVSRISLGKITLRRERVRIADVVHQAMETCTPLIAAAGQTLALRIPDDSLVVLADPTRLAQVFANLLSNAVKFTPRGGHIEFAVEGRDGVATVTVTDNGIGIAPELLPRIFEMFTQLDSSLERSHGGLGIGLSLAQSLVEMHGGRIEAHSAGLHRGSRFVVHLPLIAQFEGVQGDERRVDPAAAMSARRILVVDDNRDAAMSLAALLRLLGHEVATAFSGLEALRLAELQAPELILLDLGMPHMNGYDTAARIREQPWGRKVLLVALTGWGQESDRQRSHEAGFDHHLVKPVEVEVLERLLNELLPAPALRAGISSGALDEVDRQVV